MDSLLDGDTDGSHAAELRSPGSAVSVSASATPRLRQGARGNGLALNPHLRAFITHGRHDLVTPFYTSDRLRNLMRLDRATAGRLTVRHFHGGHMFYAWETSRQQVTTAIADFVASCLPSAPA